MPLVKRVVCAAPWSSRYGVIVDGEHEDAGTAARKDIVLKKKAATVGLPSDETEMISLLLDLLGWEVTNVQAPSDIHLADLQLLLADQGCLDGVIVALSRVDPNRRPTVAIIADREEPLATAPDSNLEFDILLRPIDIVALEMSIVHAC